MIHDALPDLWCGLITDLGATKRLHSAPRPGLRFRLRLDRLSDNQTRVKFEMGYGGPGTKPQPEGNVRADAKAGQALLASGAKLTLAGLDTTTMVKLGEADRTRLLYRNSPLTDALCGLYMLWRYEEYARPDPTLFDVVPIGMVLWPELFTSRPAHVRVTDKGMTELVPDAPPNCEIGVTVEKDELVKRVMDRYLKQNLMRQP